MLGRVGKSLILATIVITLVLAVSPTTTTTSIPRGPLREMAWENQQPVIYIVLGSSLMFISVLLVFIVAKRRSSFKRPDQETRSLVNSASERKNGDSGSNKAGLQVGVLHSLSTSTPILQLGRSADLRKEFSLGGSTLRMYWSLLSKRHSSIGLREIQRELGFSSPSSAVYQLDKLIKFGLVKKDEMGDYVVSRIIKVGFLRDFLFIGAHVLPKNAVYGALTLLVNILCLTLLVVLQVEPLVISVALLPGMISSLIFWHDTAKTLQYKQRLITGNGNERSQK